MKNSKKNEVEVVEANRAVAVKAANAEVIAEAIKKQVVAIGEIELRGNFEKLKLGAMVSEAVRIMELDGEPGRGRGNVGGGALGWWNEVCPKNERGETVIAYKTVMMWKQAAENLAGHLRHIGPGKLEEDIISAMAKNPKKLVGKDAKILKSAEKTANGMTMRQMLLWGGDEAAPKNKGGRPKAEDKPLPKLKKSDEAKAIWNVLLQQVTKTSVKDAIPLLPEKESQIAYDTLRDLADMLKKHLDEFSK